MLKPFHLLLVPALLVLVMADTDPMDFSVLCSSPGKCPAGWNNVQGDCFKFAGWDQARATVICRQNGAEYTEYRNAANRNQSGALQVPEYHLADASCLGMP